MSQKINPEYPAVGIAESDESFGLPQLKDMENLWAGMGTSAPAELEGIDDPQLRLEAYKQTEEYKSQIGPLYQRHYAMSGEGKKPKPTKVELPPLESLSAERQELIAEIREFLEAHACVNDEEGYQVETVSYVMEDAIALHEAMETIHANKIPAVLESDWDSGAYMPFSSQVGRAWHDDLVERINNCS